MTCPHGSTFPRLAINARRDLIIKRGKGRKSVVYTNYEALAFIGASAFCLCAPAPRHLEAPGQSCKTIGDMFLNHA